MASIKIVGTITQNKLVLVGYDKYSITFSLDEQYSFSGLTKQGKFIIFKTINPILSKRFAQIIKVKSFQVTLKDPSNNLIKLENDEVKLELGENKLEIIVAKVPKPQNIVVKGMLSQPLGLNRKLTDYKIILSEKIVGPPGKPIPPPKKLGDAIVNSEGEFNLEIHPLLGNSLHSKFTASIKLYYKKDSITEFEPKSFILMKGENLGKNLIVIVPPPKITKISGKVILQNHPNANFNDYKLTLSTEHAGKLFSVSPELSKTGEYKVEAVEERIQFLPNSFILSINLSCKEQPVNEYSPKTIEITKNKEYKGQNIIVLPQPNSYSINFNFFDKDSVLFINNQPVNQYFQEELGVKCGIQYQYVEATPSGIGQIKTKTDNLPAIIKNGNGKIEFSAAPWGNGDIKLTSIEVLLKDKLNEDHSLHKESNTPYILKPTIEFQITRKLSYPPEPIHNNLLRSFDLLILDFEFRYMGLDGKVIKPRYQHKPGYMIVTFPPQSFAEQAFFEADEKIPILEPKDPDYDPKCDPDSPDYDPDYIKQSEKPKIRAGSLISGQSKLVFKVEENQSIQYSEKGFLEAMSTLQLSVTPIAEKPENFKIPVIGIYKGLELRDPNDTETSIEAPYRLIISPHKYARWIHGTEVKSDQNPIELWHTKLELDSERLKKGYSNFIRAIYAKDGIDIKSLPEHSNDPFRMSLDGFDRANIVHLTSNFFLVNKPKPGEAFQNFETSPVKVKHLFLSALGAFINFRGNWDPPEDYALSVEEWQHRANMGRDHFVKVVYKGYLFPFGHRASLVKVTERKLDNKKAYLKQRMFIIVREWEKFYDSGDDKINRGWPFSRVEFKTLVTPNLDDPGKSAVNGYGRSVFWPYLGTKPFPFVIEAEDINGDIISFSTPLIFVESTNNIQKDLSVAKTDYEKDYEDEKLQKNKLSLQGQSILYADKGENENTSFDTKSMTFTAAIGKFKDNDQLFYPQINEAEVEIPALKVLLGENGTATMQYYEKYLEHGFNEQNKGEVFAQVTSAPLINFSNKGDKAGGIMQPNIKITGLSRLLGPVGGNLGDLAAGNFKPELYFAGSSAKIFGSIQLWDILEENIVFSSQDLEGIPLIETKINGDNQRVSLHWKPRLKNWDSIFEKKENSDAIISACKDGGNFSSESFIKKFTIKLLASPLTFITIEFKTIESVQGSNKPKVVFDFENIDFEGCLEFIIKLLEFVKRQKALENEAVEDENVDNENEETNAGNDESKLQFVLDVSPKGITTGFSKSIPDIEVGVLNLQNLSLAAAFSIPFSNDPLSLRFSFCEKHNPFMLTVSMFGGGGYFGIVLSPGGLLLMEAAFEFGAGISMNFGVASGSVSIMAGIYFVMEKTDDEQFSVALTGYLRINGNVRVLGIVNVSILLLMALEYHANSGKCVGRAVLIVEVSVLLFSASVEIACEKKFAGSEGDPTFQEIMEPYYDEMQQKEIKPWEDYCNAFAF